MYIIVEIFPYKNELAEILYKYGVKVIAENRSPGGKNKKGKLITQYKDLKVVLFAFQLMYLSSEEKHRKKINKFAQKSNKFYYNVDTLKEKSEYISSLTGLYNHSIENWKENEYKFFGKLGVNTDNEEDFVFFSKYIIDELRSNKELEKTYLPIFSESELRYWYGICRTRMFNVNLKDYQNFKGYNLEDIYGGSLNIESLRKLNGNF